jgi:cytochrome c2
MYAWQRNPSLVYPGTTMTQYGFEDEEHLKATIEFILNFQKLKGLRDN